MLPVPNPEVIHKPLPDGAVLFHCTEEVYFGLNAVGARVWELLGACGTPDELYAAVHAEYPDADEAEVRRDVMELLDELATSGLVRTGTPESTARADVAEPAS